MIVGFEKAVEISKKINQDKIRKMREYFISELEKIGGNINGDKKKRLANNINVSFAGKDGEIIVLALSDMGIMCSTKSACLSNQKKENRVLKAIGLSKSDAGGTVRFSLNEKIGKKEINIVIKELRKFVG